MRSRTIVAGALAAITVAGLTVVTLTQASAGAAPTVSVPSEADSPGPVNRLIVKYKSSSRAASSDDAAAEHVSAKSSQKRRNASLQRRLADGATLVDLGAGADTGTIRDMKQAFASDPDVAYVERDLLVKATAAPDDTEYAKQWDLFEATAGMNVPGAWDSTTGSGVTVAVIDTGYVAHSDVAGNIVAGYDFISDSAAARDGNGRDSDPADQGDWYAANECGFGVPASNSSWHGTHVAGTIAGVTNNGKGVAGIAYNAKIQPVRVLGKCGGYTSDIVDAITWASGGTVSGVPANANPAKVINMSLGGSGACSSTYQNAINGAVSRGTSVVVAAGNSKADVSGFTPASCNNVIAVAASNREGDRAWYSNYGAKIDITAPGGEVRKESDTPGTATIPQNGILSTVNSGTTTPTSETYKPFMGTSMASPHVAGLAALMLAKKPGLTPAEVESTIKTGARPLPGTCSGGCGAGLADATKTIQALDGTTPTTTTTAPPPPTSTTTTPPPPTTTTTTTTVAPPQPGTVSIASPGDQWAFKGWPVSGLQLLATASNALPVTFSATGLPPGLTMNSAGRITGTPTAAGFFTVTATATIPGASAKTTFGWWVWGW